VFQLWWVKNLISPPPCKIELKKYQLVGLLGKCSVYLNFLIELSYLTLEEECPSVGKFFPENQGTVSELKV
jgi:hypothetical protein